MGITHTIPNSIESGKTIEAELTIEKGDVNGFAKLFGDVPEGYTLSNIDAKTGNFTFENQKFKIIWISIPVEPSFTIKFKITSAAENTSDFTFSPKFTYLQENVKKELLMPQHTSKNANGGAIASNKSNYNTDTNSKSNIGSNEAINEKSSTDNASENSINAVVKNNLGSASSSNLSNTNETANSSNAVAKNNSSSTNSSNSNENANSSNAVAKNNSGSAGSSNSSNSNETVNSSNKVVKNNSGASSSSNTSNAVVKNNFA